MWWYIIIFSTVCCRSTMILTFNVPSCFLPIASIAYIYRITNISSFSLMASFNFSYSSPHVVSCPRLILIFYSSFKISSFTFLGLSAGLWICCIYSLLFSCIISFFCLHFWIQLSTWCFWNLHSCGLFWILASIIGHHFDLCEPHFAWYFTSTEWCFTWDSALQNT